MEPRRILIVDDDVDALRLVGMMLEREGYEIVAAANGQQAIAKAVELEPALIILDVMMPDIDGYEVAARLRGHPVTESIPILMFTAKTAVSDRVAGFQAGVDDYITKPVRPKELVSRVAVLLERRPQMEDTSGHGDIIAFLPTKGGLGTSTLTLNAAIELARMHQDKRCAAVELQEGNGTLAMQLGRDSMRETGVGLSALLERPLADLTRESVRQYMISHPSGLHVLPAGTQPAGFGPSLDKAYVQTLLRFLRSEYDYLLLDLAPRLDASYREVLALCNQVFVTLEPNRIGIALTKAVLKALEDLHVGRHKTNIVLIHRVPASSALSRSMIEQSIQRNMVAGIPPASDLAYESIENGKPMVEMQPQGLVAQQVRRVVQAIVED
jgi:pilus assembly protein CpaE